VINHNGSLLPSVTFGLTAIIVCLVICLLTIGLMALGADDRGDFWILACLPVLVALALIIAPLFGYYPYKADYHRLQPATGIVQAVDSRFLAASQYVVVTYDSGLTVRCDDSRCATVRVGDQLRLLCTKEHQFGSPLGADGWGCRWGQDAP
jgi:hypothetical protein